MSDYIEVAPGLVVTEDGEIVEAADIDDPLKFIVLQRHEANMQIKQWEARKAVLDQVIQKRQSDRTVTYGDVVSAIRGGSYNKTDSEALAKALVCEGSPLAEAFDFEHTDKVAVVLALIGAASGFRKDDVPADAKPLYEAHTATLEKRPWVETSVARKAAPARVTRQAEAE